MSETREALDRDRAIRLAAESDAGAIARIYTPIVERTAISFELEPPGVAEIARRIRTTLETHPWLVYVEDAQLRGYAYAGAYRGRPAYRWAAEVSVYVDPEARARRVGTALYSSLLAALRLQGCYDAYAVISLPNPASVRLHESLGFRRVALFPRVGYKLGRWHDVGWWHLELEPDRPPDPTPPRRPAELSGSSAWKAALAGGLDRLQD